MKFRNKETGKTRDFEFIAITKDMDAELAKYAHNAPVLICRSIAELNEEWEDYTPKEPLIKDEKIRKIIRAWAEANGDASTTKLKFNEDDARLSTETSCIEFDKYQPFDRLEDCERYTVAELCGEA